MGLSKTQLENLVKSCHVDINATLARNIPSVGTDLTVSALEEILNIHSNNADRSASPLVYTSSADPVERLADTMNSALASRKEPQSQIKLIKHSRAALEGVEYADSVLRGKQSKFQDGDSVLDVYLLLSAAIHTIMLMAPNPSANFSVMDLILGTAASAAHYTAEVWGVLGAVFSHLVDPTLINLSDPKATLELVREAAMLGNPVQLFKLHAKLRERARQNTANTKCWKDAMRCAADLKFGHEELHLEEAIMQLAPNQYATLLHDANNGAPVTFRTVDRVKREIKPVGNPEAPPSVQELMDKNKLLQRQLREARSAVDSARPKLNSFSPELGVGQCSKGICDIAHGELPCPFEGSLCKWCLKPYGTGHESFGKCQADRRVDKMDVSGKTCSRIRFQHRGGRGAPPFTPSTDSPSRQVTTPLPSSDPSASLKSLNIKHHVPRPLPPPSSHVSTTSPSPANSAISPPTSDAILPTTYLSSHCSSIHEEALSSGDVGLDAASSQRQNQSLVRTNASYVTSMSVNTRQTGNANSMSECARTVAQRDEGGQATAPASPPARNLSTPIPEASDHSMPLPNGVTHSACGLPYCDRLIPAPTRLDNVQKLLEKIRRINKRARKRLYRCLENPDRPEMPLSPPELPPSPPEPTPLLPKPLASITDAVDSYGIQSDNARRNMWYPDQPMLFSADDSTRRPSRLEFRNWQPAKPPITRRGIIKFYARTRGKGTSSDADLPWGFITPLKDGKVDTSASDIHFNLYALQSIPEPAVQKNTVVEYTMIPGTNSARTVDAVTLHYDHATTDSGAWMHACGRKDDLWNYRPLRVPIPVGTARNGDVIFLEGVGDLPTRTADGYTVFRNVFYSPDCSSTLLSVKVLTKFFGWELRADKDKTILTHPESGQTINLDDNFRFAYTPEERAARPFSLGKPMTPEEVAALPGMDFLDPQATINTVNLLRSSAQERAPLYCHDTPLTAYMNKGLLEFRPMEFKDDTSYCKWHRRLGHLSINYIKKFAAQHGINLTGRLGPHTCETCALSKLVQRISRNSRNRAPCFLDRVHADLIGPFTPLSREGYKYALVLVDCHSREPFISYHKSKTAADIHQGFEAFCTEVGGQPKEVRVDGGKEFQGVCKEWCDANRIRISLSPPYAHYLNGVVERKIRSIKEMTRCILNYSRLPATFWADAMQVSQYLITRLPTTALPNWKSPFEIRYGRKPKVRHIRIFGSKVIYKKGPISKTMDDVSAALQPKGKEGILIGFEGNHPTGTYKIWDTSTHKVVYSNCVEIFENQNIHHTVAADFFNDDTTEHQEFHVDELYMPDLDSEDDDLDVFHDIQHEHVPTAHLDPNNIITGRRNRTRTDFYDPVVEAARPQLGSASVLRPNPSIFLMNGTLKGEEMVPTVPKTEAEALSHPVFGQQWREAKAKELEQFNRFKAYDAIPRNTVPRGAQILPTHFIRTIKRCGKFKYRLVAEGNHQVGDTCYSPTAAITALRMLLGICVQRGYQVRSADVSAAYLQSPIEDNVYVEQPPDPSIPPEERRKTVWKLNKAMYGLRKSPLYWHKTVQSAMKKFGLTQSDTDPCIYTH